MHSDSRWEDGTPRSRHNAFDWRAFATALLVGDMEKAQTAARVGAAAAATKRAAGQPVMPRLRLAGSQFKEAV